MKKIIFVSLCSMCLQLRAQELGSSIALSIGTAEDGVGLIVNYNNFLNRHNDSSIEVDAYLAFANYKYTDINIAYAFYAIQIGYAQEVWRNPKRSIRFSLLGGTQLGYESVGNGKTILDSGAVIQDESKIIYGLYGGGEFDYIISNKMSLTLRLQENLHINSDVGFFTPYFGVGIRYYNE